MSNEAVVTITKNEYDNLLEGYPNLVNILEDLEEFDYCKKIFFKLHLPLFFYKQLHFG